MTRYVAVIDLGKTNSKLALVDTLEASELEVLTSPAATRQHGPYPSLDDPAIEHFITTSLSELARYTRVDALTVTTHGATAALIDHTGELALPVMDYEFAGVDEIAEEYDALRPDFSETGSPRLPGGLNIGAQFYWQLQRYPQAFASTACILTWPQYWVHRLCDVRCNDVSSLGAHTDLYNPHKRCFSSLVDRMQWLALMPPNEPSGKAVGRLTERFCQRVGIDTAPAVHTGIHDSNASLVPHLLGSKDPFSVVSTGTWIICMSMGGTAVELDEHRDCLYNVNAFGEPVASTRFMGGREREMLLQQDRHNVEASAEQREAAFIALLERPVEQVALHLPTVVPRAGPYPNAQARWIEADEAIDPIERDCCISLYLALMTAQCLTLLGSRGPIHVEGPGAHDSIFTRMLMAETNRQVLVSEAATGTSVGAAMLIARPRQLPAGEPIRLSTTERQWLSDYASRWHRVLRQHLRD